MEHTSNRPSRGSSNKMPFNWQLRSQLLPDAPYQGLKIT